MASICRTEHRALMTGGAELDLDAFIKFNNTNTDIRAIIFSFLMILSVVDFFVFLGGFIYFILDFEVFDLLFSFEVAAMSSGFSYFLFTLCKIFADTPDDGTVTVETTHEEIPVPILRIRKAFQWLAVIYTLLFLYASYAFMVKFF